MPFPTRQRLVDAAGPRQAGLAIRRDGSTAVGRSDIWPQVESAEGQPGCETRQGAEAVVGNNPPARIECLRRRWERSRAG